MIHSILSLMNHLCTNNNYLLNCKSLFIINSNQLLIQLLNLLKISIQKLNMHFLEMEKIKNKNYKNYKNINNNNNTNSNSNSNNNSTGGTTNNNNYDHDNDSSNQATMYTQIIKNITSLSMHLLLLTCHSSSTNDHMQLSFTREKSSSLLKSIIMNACSSKTPKIRKLSTNVIKCVLESVHAPLKVHVFTLPFLDFIVNYFQAINPISTDTFKFTTSNTTGNATSNTTSTSKFTTTKTAGTMGSQAQEKMLDALVCLRVIMPVLVKQSAGCSNVATKLEFLCKYLLSLPVTSDGILTRWVCILKLFLYFVQSLFY